jgi:hypothetical protein
MRAETAIRQDESTTMLRCFASVDHDGMFEHVLSELLQMDQVADHFVGGEVIEEAQHAQEQQSVLAAAELLRHDDAGMRATGRVPLLVERSEIANVEREKRPVLPAAKASCSSSAAVSFPASSVLKTSKPRPRRSTAKRAMIWRSR